MLHVARIEDGHNGPSLVRLYEAAALGRRVKSGRRVGGRHGRAHRGRRGEDTINAAAWWHRFVAQELRPLLLMC